VPHCLPLDDVVPPQACSRAALHSSVGPQKYPRNASPSGISALSRRGTFNGRANGPFLTEGVSKLEQAPPYQTICTSLDFHTGDFPVYRGLQEIRLLHGAARPRFDTGSTHSGPSDGRDPCWAERLNPLPGSSRPVPRHSFLGRWVPDFAVCYGTASGGAGRLHSRRATFRRWNGAEAAMILWLGFGAPPTTP
jgi:hypothetical protein